MRSLPDRFESKMTALEENGSYKDMKPSEVIERLLAYESRKAPTSTPPKKQKGIALKVSKVEKEEKIDSDEDLALFVKRFNKVIKFGKKGFESKGQNLKKKGPFKKFEPRQEKAEIKGVRCYKCGGIGHFTPECANHNDKKKGKVMAATWSGSSVDSNEGNESSDDEDLMANFLAFASSHKSKNASEKEQESQEEMTQVKMTPHVTPQMDMWRKSEQVERTKKIEDKLGEELDLSKMNEEGMRELEEAKGLLTRIAYSTKKLDHMLGVGKSPCDKRGLGFDDGKETSTSNKTVFVKSLSNEVASPVQTHRNKIDLGQCSHSVQVMVAQRRQPQAQPSRAPQVNFPQQMALNKGKRPIMQPQARKQARPVKQRRYIEPIQPQ
ncbi:hypothetical protein QYF36_023877 [Acer negundo]|nr:hypothetical protein QYF36_023877 [Acer negundo]